MLPPMAARSTGRRFGRKKAGQPVRFVMTGQTLQAVDDYVRASGRKPGEFLFIGRCGLRQCMTIPRTCDPVSILDGAGDPVAAALPNRTSPPRATEISVRHCSILNSHPHAASQNVF